MDLMRRTFPRAQAQGASLVVLRSAVLNMTLAMLLALIPAVAVAAVTPKSSSPSTPQLSIAVDNGRTSTRPGDKLTYSIVVSNLGTTTIKGLRVTQSVPAGLKLVTTDPAGVAKAGSVSWRLDLRATAKATIHTTMTVTNTPAELLRLATVACASLSAGKTPIVCASHSDQLPAGAAAEASKRTASQPGSSSGRVGWSVGGGLVLVAGVAALVARRRRSARSGA